MKEAMFYILMGEIIVITTWFFAYQKAKKDLISRILKQICKDWHRDLEEEIKKHRTELLRGTIHYEFRLLEIRRWIAEAHLTLSDVGINEAMQQKIIKKGANIKARSLFKELSCQNDNLRPVERQRLFEDLLKELKLGCVNAKTLWG